MILLLLSTLIERPLLHVYPSWKWGPSSVALPEISPFIFVLKVCIYPNCGPKDRILNAQLCICDICLHKSNWLDLLWIWKKKKMWCTFDCVCKLQKHTKKTSMFSFVFILQSPDEQIHHFRKEIDICKKIIIQFSQYRLCTEWNVVKLK